MKHEPTTRANSTKHRHTQICEWSIHSSGKHAFQHPKPSHTGRRAGSRRMLRGIWPRVRVRHCDSCIVRISSVHFRTFALWPGTWLVCAHLTWSTHCMSVGKGELRNTIIPILLCTRSPHYSMLPKYAQGAFLFSGFITIFLNSPHTNIHVFLAMQNYWNRSWDLREYFREKVVMCISCMRKRIQSDIS